MKDFDVAERLNQLNKPSPVCDCGVKHTLPVTFIGGNYLAGIKTAVKEKAPYCRVALVATEKTYIEFATPVQTAVLNIGGKFTGLVLDEPTVQSVDNASELFNLPEDVRAVIVFDKSLFDITAYYATLKGIALIAIPLILDMSYTLNVNSYFINGKNIDKVDISADRYVVFDQNIIDIDIPETYALIMSKLPALIDYRLCTAVYNIEPCKYAYSIAKKAILTAFSAVSIKPQDIPLALLQSSGYLGYANALTGGMLCDFSSADVVAKLCDNNCNGGLQLYSAVKIMAIYDLCFNGYYDNINELPDYVSRAEYFSKAYPFPETQLSKNLVTQIRAIRHGEKKLNAVIKSVKADVSSNTALGENILKIYNALGGITPTPNELGFKQALKHGGDAPYFVNGLSIARSKGVLEYIK